VVEPGAEERHAPRREDRRDPAVGDLGGQGHVLPPHRPQGDRQIPAAAQGGAARVGPPPPRAGPPPGCVVVPPAPQAAFLARTIATYSRVLPSGLPKACPCQPSTTCGPDTPSPSRNRPPESASKVIAVIAVAAGVRPAICMIAVPTWMRCVRAAIHVAVVTASEPYDSDVQTES